MLVSKDHRGDSIDKRFAMRADHCEPPMTRTNAVDRFCTLESLRAACGTLHLAIIKAIALECGSDVVLILSIWFGATSAQQKGAHRLEVRSSHGVVRPNAGRHPVRVERCLTYSMEGRVVIQTATGAPKLVSSLTANAWGCNVGNIGVSESR